jgi:hypothetical protein
VPVFCSQIQLLRGNPFVNKISIGGVSPLVPPLPGRIGSNVTGGIAKHGGFEGSLLNLFIISPGVLSPLLGDASITRADVHIGDNRNFQDILYDLVREFQYSSTTVDLVLSGPTVSRKVR